MAKKLSTFVFGGNLPATVMSPAKKPPLSQMLQAQQKSPSGKLGQQRKQAEAMRVEKKTKTNIISLVGDISQELLQQSPIQITQGPSIKAQSLAVARQKKQENQVIRGIVGTVADELQVLQQTPVLAGESIIQQQTAVNEQLIKQSQQPAKKTKAEIREARAKILAKARGVKGIDQGLHPTLHKSSHITAINFDELLMTIQVEFNTGAIYEYNLANHPYGAALGTIVLRGLEWCRTDDPTGQRRWWKFKEPSHGAAVYWDLYKKGVPYKRIR